MLTPVVAERPAQPYVAIGAQVTMQTMDTILQPLQPQVLAWLRERDIPAAWPPFWKYNVIDMDRVLEVEVGVPVTAPVDGDDRVLAGMLPAGRYATLRYTGHPDGLIRRDRVPAGVGQAGRPHLGYDEHPGRGAVGGPPGDLRDRPRRRARHDQVDNPARVPPGRLAAPARDGRPGRRRLQAVRARRSGQPSSRSRRDASVDGTGTSKSSQPARCDHSGPASMTARRGCSMSGRCSWSATRTLSVSPQPARPRSHPAGGMRW